MRLKVPCFDSHFHIIDPRFTLIPNHGYLPKPFTAEHYLKQVDTLNLNVQGGAVVSGSFQGFDTDYLLQALSVLGSRYVGVVNLPHDVPDEKILQLHQAGVRAVRFNCYRGGSETVEHLEELAWRVHQLVNWHVELYISNEQLADLVPLLLELPVVSIDHLGLSQNQFENLLSLVEAGVYVKATRFSILSFDIACRIRALVDCNPNAVMFGTDLPGTRAPRQFSHEDFDLIASVLNEEELTKVMLSNATYLYHERFT